MYSFSSIVIDHAEDDLASFKWCGSRSEKWIAACDGLDSVGGVHDDVECIAPKLDRRGGITGLNGARLVCVRTTPGPSEAALWPADRVSMPASSGLAYSAALAASNSGAKCFPLFLTSMSATDEGRGVSRTGEGLFSGSVIGFPASRFEGRKLSELSKAPGMREEEALPSSQGRRRRSFCRTCPVGCAKDVVGGPRCGENRC